MANGNDKDWLDTNTNLPEDNIGKDRNRELFDQKPFEIGEEGYTPEEIEINKRFVENIKKNVATARGVGVSNIKGPDTVNKGVVCIRNWSTRVVLKIVLVLFSRF